MDKEQIKILDQRVAEGQTRKCNNKGCTGTQTLERETKGAWRHYRWRCDVNPRDHVQDIASV